MRRELINYWRKCLADTTLGKGRFDAKLQSNHIKISKDELSTGHLKQHTLDILFKDADASDVDIEVCLWPLLARLRTSHGQDDRRLPRYVAPIVSIARVVRKDGALRPAQTVITRDLLEPLAEGEFSIGKVDNLDNFLTKSIFSVPASETSQKEVWSQYRDECARLRKSVVEDWPDGDKDFERTGGGLVTAKGEATAYVRNIVNLYDAILNRETVSELMQAYAIADKTPVRQSLKAPYSFSGRLAHSTGDFPLTDKQREVLAHLGEAKWGEILAVNGPPGTGKTTMLLSAIACEWVRAARIGGNPPVIAAASTNNQAVTNIIDAFAKDFGVGEGSFAGRWLPDIESFGLYLPARSRLEEASRKYQTESFFENIESEENVRQAEQHYLTAAQKAFPSMESPEVSEVVDALREEIEVRAGRLETADRARSDLIDAGSEVVRLLGEIPLETLAKIKDRSKELAREDSANERLLAAWRMYLVDEPLYLSFFAFIPAIANRRRLKASRFLEQVGYADAMDPSLKIESVEHELSRLNFLSHRRFQLAQKEEVQAQAAITNQTSACQHFTKALADIGIKDTGLDDVAKHESILDRGLRFEMFLLATHYWEGRWLLEMLELGSKAYQDRKKKGRKTVEPRWRRRMMLTPCAVCTFAMLPEKMSVSRYEGKEYVGDYLFDFIDLLIVEEAGQVLPEVAGASFALARKALVIGDTRQIEPIPEITKAVDIGNLVEAELLSEDATQDERDAIEELGVTSTGGSAMQVAQAACRYHTEPELDRGFYLLEQRRCYDEIVDFCNLLCYQGKLQPRRGRYQAQRTSKAGIPGPLAYLHVDGLCATSQGSRGNRTEAQTIAAWLASESKALEGAYGKQLAEIVGVVTPFSRQVREIAQACEALEIQVGGSKGVTVGTIHALQGADRDLVIFSPCYSKHSDGGFIDRSASMLNVAVSRAKDAFVVFGDMDLFSRAKSGTPRRKLGDFLFSSPINAMQFETAKRDDLVESGQLIQTLRDAEEHDRFLLGLLRDDDIQRIVIVSPWIRIDKMNQVGILDGFGEMCKRGASVEVYCDPELTDQSTNGVNSNLDRARKLLAKIGVDLREVDRLHSKIVIADKGLLSVGSFNWLSASRVGEYVRHETSLVYRGAQLSHEIELISESLESR